MTAILEGRCLIGTGPADESLVLNNSDVPEDGLRSNFLNTLRVNS